MRLSCRHVKEPLRVSPSGCGGFLMADTNVNPPSDPVDPNARPSDLGDLGPPSLTMKDLKAAWVQLVNAPPPPPPAQWVTSGAAYFHLSLIHI